MDGYGTGVGIPCDPVHTRAWLAEAGCPEEQGLPSGTITVNEPSFHEPVAQEALASWPQNLGVTVELEALPWEGHSAAVRKGELQIWRIAWCADHSEGHDYIVTAIQSVHPAG